MATSNLIKTEISWLQRHERLVISAMVVVVVLYLGSSWIDRSAEKAKTEFSALQPALAATIQSNKDLATVVEKQSQDYQQLVQTLLQQNTEIRNGISSRNSQVVVQQKADYSMPLSDLAVRWKTLASISDVDIRKTDTGLELTENGSRSTVSQLERVPVLQQNLSDTTTIIANNGQQIEALSATNKNLTEQVTGLNTQVKEADESCRKQVAVVKADARKSKRNWFVAGTVLGAVIKAVVTGFIHG